MKYVELGQLVKIQKGKKLDEVFVKSTDTVRYIQIEDLRNNENIKYTLSDFKSSICDKNNILIAWDGANAGTIGFGLEGAIGSTLAKLTPIKEFFTPFVGRFLQSKFTYLRSSCTGATIPHISKSVLTKIQVPFPPLPEQKRIAKILDKADALRQKNKQLLATYDELLKATFLDMFGDPVTNPKGWDVIPFSKCGRFISGGTPNKAKKKYWEGSFPWVSPKDMKVSTIYDSQDHISEIVFEETTQKKIPVDHVLIVVRGMILAHSFPVAINKVEVAINQDMKAIKPSKELDPVFLQYCLFAQRRQILEIISTAGHGTRKLDAIAIERLLITVPPVLLQNQFAQIVGNIEAQKTLVKQSMQESEDLFNGLVQKAFGGQLQESERESISVF